MDNKKPYYTITTPERLVRMLDKIGSAALSVLMRSPERPKVAVKGRAAALGRAGVQQFSVVDISEKGIAYLKTLKQVELEILTPSTRLIANCSIAHAGDARVILTLPNEIRATERRHNTRINCSPELASFIRVKRWQVSQSVDTVPSFSTQKHLTLFFPVANISSAGLCFYSYFPNPISTLNSEQEEDCTLHLPLLAPIDIRLSMRWIGPHSSGTDQKFRFSRAIGAQFIDLPKEAENSILRYIKQLLTGQAL